MAEGLTIVRILFMEIAYFRDIPAHFLSNFDALEGCQRPFVL